ncbi:MAG: hypothetical protein RSA89_04580, partial [Raoultibacter sp.]
AGFPITALATGEAATPQNSAATAPSQSADAQTPAADAGETSQVEAPITDTDANTDAAPGTIPSTPAPDAETPQAEAPATDAGTNSNAAGSVTNPPVASVATPDLTVAPLAATPAADPAAATDVAIDETNFPGEKFRAYVQDNLDTNNDGILDTDEIKAAKSIYVQWQGITTLKGLEYFTALTSLSCYYNPLTTLDISANTALTSLQCFGDSLTTLDLSHNPALVYLDCGGNNLTTLDVSKNTALDTLRCENNKLTTLNLAGLNKLSEISWCTNFSPQAPQIPVVKRGETAYELDLETLAKGKTLTAITLNGKSVDWETYQKRRDTAPQSLQYTCNTGGLGVFEGRLEVNAAGFDYSYLATLDAGTNGTLTCDGAPSGPGEILLAENSTPTFTVTPESGYQVATLTVNGTDAKEDLVAKDATSQTLPLLPVTDAVTIAVTFEKIPAPIEPPVDPTDPVDPPNPPVDPVDPPKPPVDPADPVNPPTPPAVPDNGGNNGGGTTTIVERTNTVVVPAAPQAATLETPAAPATAAAKTEAPAKAAADSATLQGQLENPTLGAQAFDMQHSHIPLALLLLTVWLVGGFAVIRQRKHTHDAIDGASY